MGTNFRSILKIDLAYLSEGISHIQQIWEQHCPLASHILSRKHFWGRNCRFPRIKQSCELILRVALAVSIAYTFISSVCVRSTVRSCGRSTSGRPPVHLIGLGAVALTVHAVGPRLAGRTFYRLGAVTLTVHGCDGSHPTPRKSGMFLASEY